MNIGVQSVCGGRRVSWGISRRLIGAMLVVALSVPSASAQELKPPGAGVPARANGGLRPVSKDKLPENLPTPPKAEKIAHEREIHGLKLTDEYFWLRERDNPKVLEHLKAENEYTRVMTSHTEPLQSELYQEMLGRIKQTDLSVPSPKSGYLYYSRTEEGKAHPIYCRKKGSESAPEQVLLDVNETVKDLPNGMAGPVAYSPDSNIMAYMVDPTGGRVLTIRFKDLTTGKDLPDTIENAAGSVVIAQDNKTVFYTTLDKALRPDTVWRHRLGEDVSKDQKIHTESDERFFVGVDASLSEQYIFMSMGSMKTTEVWYLKSADAGKEGKAGEFRVIKPREQGVEYGVAQHEDTFYIWHNKNALNFTLVKTPASDPAESNWKTVIPASDATLIESVECFKNHMVITGRENGLPALWVRDLKSGEQHAIGFPEQAYTLSAAQNREYDTSKFRLAYSSPITPGSVFEYDMATRQRTLLKERPVLGGYDRSKYAVEHVMAKAADGAEIPLTIVHLKTVTADGQNPCLLYAYGSYGLSTDAGFSSNIISLLDRGVVYALAHIRGGSEKGRSWYESGRLMNKKNTFTDYIACAEHLTKSGWTTKSRLVGMGGSAGGLLMGAVANMRPDLFKAIVAEVPFVDMINTMLDPDLPLTVIEYEQWGNPNEKDAFEYMRSYSPYDNVAKKEYPAILAMTGFHDSNVSYWEPAKWVQRLRDNTTGKRPILLKVNLDAGHGGASDRYAALKEDAFMYAFVLDQVGATAKRP